MSNVCVFVTQITAAQPPPKKNSKKSSTVCKNTPLEKMFISRNIRKTTECRETRLKTGVCRDETVSVLGNPSPLGDSGGWGSW